MKEHEVILTIVNTDYAEIVMDAARSKGATGGTILTARGAGGHEAEKLFGLTITPEKEIVMILIEKSLRDEVMKAIIERAGLNTKGKGICFSLPVDDVMGIAED
ncbi:MAG: P-II family nitrogen regulator [Clostridia bacterium]|nr:P-II family nitrogen regulator [Clostridia bacterium]